MVGGEEEYLYVTKKKNQQNVKVVNRTLLPNLEVYVFNIG